MAKLTHRRRGLSPPWSPEVRARHESARRVRFGGRITGAFSYLPAALGCESSQLTGIPVILPLKRTERGAVVFASPFRSGAVVEAYGSRSWLVSVLKSAGFTVAHPHRREPALHPVALDRVAFLREGSHEPAPVSSLSLCVPLSPGACLPRDPKVGRLRSRWPRAVADSVAHPRRWTDARRAELRAWMLRELARPSLVATRLKRARQAQRRLTRLRDASAPRLTGPCGGGVRRNTPETVRAWRRAWRQRRRAAGFAYA